MKKEKNSESSSSEKNLNDIIRRKKVESDALKKLFDSLNNESANQEKIKTKKQ